MANHDPGEQMFERYAHDLGYQLTGPDVDLGTGKRPDYLVHAGGQDVVVEVETFEQRIPLPAPGAGGFVAGADATRVRRKISAGAVQLEGIDGRPLVVVLANPLNLWVPLDPPQVIEAMYGDLIFSFGDGGIRWEAGRNGRLHVPLPDGGRQRGNHAHVSAVCVIREALREDAEILSRLNVAPEGTNPLSVLATALAADESLRASSTVTWLDVFETVSESAVPLARNIFSGPHDTRWGVTGPGTFGRLA